MPNKKPFSSRLKNTLNELDCAIEQWDSITNKPQGEQGMAENPAQQRAKSLLKELREQLEDFDKPQADPSKKSL